MTEVLSASAGTYTVRLENFTPSPRDGVAAGPWTSINVQEAASSGGPWNDLGSVAIGTTDTDPEDPAARDIFVTGVEFVSGWYLVTFLDAAGNSQPVSPVYNGPQIRSSVREIGALLHSYTTIEGSGEAGTFNDDTDPTGDQVDALIDVALDEVVIHLPDTLTAKQIAVARRAVGYLAAILVLNSHFSDQVEAGDTLASMYQGFYDKAIATLDESLSGDLPPGPSAFAITTPTELSVPVSSLDASGRWEDACWPYWAR